MKKRVFILALAPLIAGIMLCSCQSSSEKIKNAENEVQEANQDLNEVRQDSITEYQKFKIESDEKIAAHEQNIAEFKARISNEKK